MKIYGDLIVDRWVTVKTTRNSPEAPIPIYVPIKEDRNLGGGGFVANCLKNLGVDVQFHSLFDGWDDFHALQKSSGDSSLRTPVKTRYIDESGRHIMRIDDESSPASFPVGENYATWHCSKCFYEKDEVVVVSDYGKGSISSYLTTFLSDRGCKTVVDVKQPSGDWYNNAYFLKCNESEWKSICMYSELSSIDNIMKKYGWTYVLVTLGSRGARLYEVGSEVLEFSVPFSPKNPDVTGAGDVITAVVAYFMDLGLPVSECVEKAMLAAARHVGRKGMNPISLSDLESVTVFANGCFDFLHYGHMELLKEASMMGDRLIVGLNSDSSVKKLKGEHRPLLYEDIRKEMLENLPYVNKVIIFDKDTPYELIKELKPDIIVKGEDYKDKKVVGEDLAEVRFVKLVPGWSTTKIFEKMLKNE
ncbi:MAG: PfkB family carbohydrate kinase [Pseudomonadales bacterium]|jgi:D-beta-D-heptose 7-phosphate kinase/D-beta-D-heptose 1-phosphate adenosyltransferase